MNRKDPHLIFIKKTKLKTDSSHHGSWKIAYADFMTTMMVLFLLMWIVSYTTNEQRQQLAGYFNASLTPELADNVHGQNNNNIIPGDNSEVLSPEGDDFIHLNMKDTQQFEELQKRFDALIKTNPILNDLKSNLLFKLIDSGLLIQLTDSHDRPMFMVGSKKPEAYLVDILQGLVPVLNSISQRLILTGHTDSLPFAHGERGYSNWELSTDRANAVRQILTASGLHRDKILQVIGVANNMAIDINQPEKANNRRITILILADEKEKQIISEDRIIKRDSIAGDEP